MSSSINSRLLSERSASSIRLSLVVALIVGFASLAATGLGAADCCDPNSPFRSGEGYADTPATCENLAYWADRAPINDARVSMVVKGKLSEVHWDGVIAYLEMCDPKSLRVVCVTYATNGMRAGDIVSFAGGYVSANEKWVKLDPCLASR
jgi:hypothetical protein